MLGEVMDVLDYSANREVIEGVMEVNRKLNEAMDDASVSGQEITKLMYEQMLKGLGLGTVRPF